MMAVTKRTRFEVLRRDNYTCQYCRATNSPLTVDHVVPVALGGADTADNLVTACRDCNAGKASCAPDARTVAVVANATIQWAAALRWALDQQARSLADRIGQRAEFRCYWDEWQIDGEQIPLPNGWEDSVDRWRALGVSNIQLREAIRIAMTRQVQSGDEFRYAAGVVWNMIDDLRVQVQQRAEGGAHS